MARYLFYGKGKTFLFGLDKWLEGKRMSRREAGVLSRISFLQKLISGTEPSKVSFPSSEREGGKKGLLLNF